MGTSLKLRFLFSPITIAITHLIAGVSRPLVRIPAVLIWMNRVEGGPDDWNSRADSDKVARHVMRGGYGFIYI